MKTAGNIFAAILVFFGVLFVWGAFSDNGGGLGWIAVGAISTAVGLGILWYLNRKEPAPQEHRVTYQVELTGDVNLENFQCRQCGGALSGDNVKLVGGALNVECPYCGAIYQVEEKPKW